MATSLQKERQRLRTFSWTGAALLIGSLLLVNFLAAFLPVRLDLSEGRAYSISKGTKDLLKKLDDTVLVKMMFSSELPPVYKLNERYVADLLREYQNASQGKLRVEYADPGKDNKTRGEAIGSGVIPVQLVIQHRDKREVQECFMGLSLSYGGRSEAVAFIQDTSGLEYEITQRIKKLIDPKRATIGVVLDAKSLGFTAGPLQPLNEPISTLYDIREISLKDGIPPEVKSLWMMGPAEKIDPAVVQVLHDYLAKGGFLGLLVDTRSVQVESFLTRPLDTGIDTLLSPYGLKLGPGLVNDLQCDRIQVQAMQGSIRWVNLVDYPFFPWITNVDTEHPATKVMDGFSVPFAAPITVQKEMPGLKYRSLGRTSKASWIDEDPINASPLEARQKPEGAASGPFTVVMLVEGKFGPAAGDNAPTGRLAIFSTSRFIRTDYPPRQSNYALFLNMLDWSVQDETLLSIRSKGVSPKPIRHLSDAVRVLVKYLLLGFLPLATLGLGLFVWKRMLRRRARLALAYNA